jgi:hypothetical protein
MTTNRRYFQIAGLTVCVESDLDFDKIRFKPELAAFSVANPSDDSVTLRHYFRLPNLKGVDLGKMLYYKVPWMISRDLVNGTWYYRTLPLDDADSEGHRVAIFTADHMKGTIYSPPSKEASIHASGWESLSLFPTDQVWLAPILADRHAAIIHSAAVILNGQGLLFVGHSSAGKSTIIKMLKAAASLEADTHRPLKMEVLCDDRNVIRKWFPTSSTKGKVQNMSAWRVHGTWSHGEISDVSPASASLHAILFLQQDTFNMITPMTNRKEILKRLLGTLIKPMVTADWWQKEIELLADLVNEVPFYIMQFDKSGVIVDRLVTL